MADSTAELDEIHNIYVQNSLMRALLEDVLRHPH
ncbi:hypothetical protein EST38_g11940 [Candolleomyces aberdarensis]|uniref:Uncharacterized protein n=1 Tax=Candolleomyces aberdarensis TaxID=2316362 RepID=A0A4Q2D569_9AGAR|nr:hypothetical protein EST38_g11940 [Candolleomyces aberdarensis]